MLLHVPFKERKASVRSQSSKNGVQMSGRLERKASKISGGLYPCLQRIAMEKDLKWRAAKRV